MLAQIATTILGFFVLVVLLRKFFWTAVLRLLDDRRARIEEAFNTIARSKQDVERLQADYTRRIAEIDEEARSKIQQAIIEGKRMAMEVQDHARSQAHAIINKSRETLELELSKAKIVLREQVAQMTVEAVERILKEKLDASKDKRLVDSVLDELSRYGS